MKFSQRSALSALATVTAFVGRSQAQGPGDCNGGPWNTHEVGYNTGGEFCSTKWKEGAAINGIQAWANGDSVNGIEFQFTSGVAPERYGQMTGDKKEWLTWDTTTDTVESITVWPNGHSDVERVAAIQIKISNRDAWKVGKEPKNTQGYDMPVVNGAGIIMGAYGRQGGSIDKIAFLMMDSAIKNRDVKDFTPNADSLNGNNEALKNQKPEAIDSFTQENWTGEKMEYTVDRTIRKLKSWSTTRSSSKTFGGSVGASIDFGLPAIGLGGSVTTEFHWETTNSIETSEAGEKEEQLQFSVSGKIPKGEAIYCESLAFSGKYDLDYASTIELELQSGKTWSYNEAGTVKGVAWSKNENKCISYKEGQSGAAVLEAKLAEWKDSPDKEEEERQDREQRAEDDLKESEPTSTAEASPTGTETDEATPTKTDKASPTETDEATPTETDVPEEEEEEETTEEEEEEEPTDEEDEELTEEDEPVDDEETTEEDEDLIDEDEDAEETVDEEDEPVGDEDEELMEEDEPVDDEETTEEDEELIDENEDTEETVGEEDEELLEEDEPVDDEETTDEGEELTDETEDTEETFDEEDEELADDEEEEEEPLDEEDDGLILDEETITEDEPPTTSTVTSGTTIATGGATIDINLDTPKPTATEEEPAATTTSKARTTRSKAVARAAITPAPVLVNGKRSLTFTA